MSLAAHWGCDVANDLDVAWHRQGADAGNQKPEVVRRFGMSWLEKARHHVLLMRLQRPYFVYCAVCFLLSFAAFFSTLVDLSTQSAAGKSWHDILQGRTWQSACWSFVALALCAEVVSGAVVRRGCFRTV